MQVWSTTLDLNPLCPNGLRLVKRTQCCDLWQRGLLGWFAQKYGSPMAPLTAFVTVI